MKYVDVGEYFFSTLKLLFPFFTLPSLFIAHFSSHSPLSCTLLVIVWSSVSSQKCKGEKAGKGICYPEGKQTRKQVLTV